MRRLRQDLLNDGHYRGLRAFQNKDADLAASDELLNRDRLPDRLRDLAQAQLGGLVDIEDRLLSHANRPCLICRLGDNPHAR